MKNSGAKLQWFLLLMASTISLAGCDGLQSSVNPGGPQAHNISKIWWLMLYVSTVVFIIVIAALLVGVSKGRRRQRSESEEVRNAPELILPEPSKRKHRTMVIAATSVTVLTLFVFLVQSFLIGRGLTAELSRKKAVVIEITGHQWWWEVRYMNNDASSIFTTANEIHIPVGVPVTFSLKAGDVIHSFWVPNLNGKTDLIPGKIATTWLQADQPGVYRGQCAEYCGLQHAHMALWIVAEPAPQFNSWLQAQLQSAQQPATDSQKRGFQVFLSSTCVMCHAVNGTPAGSNFGPNLTHVASRKTIAAATMQNTRDHLAQWISDSQQVKPGNRMPPSRLSPEDLQAVLDYLQSLK
ncbi:MAG: cytochrome c oxidase subunit II [Pyrinomonadaceae bacterium]